MKSILLVLIVAVCALPLGAQRTTSIGFGGGVAVPVGSFGDSYTSGPEGMVTLITGSANSPLGARFDYAYDSFRGRSASGVTGAGTGAGTHVNSLTANLVIAARAGGLKPYALAGYGWYPYTEPGTTQRTNAFGLNGGVGIAFPLPYTPVGGFIEARYADARSTGHKDRRFVPVTLGLTF